MILSVLVGLSQGVFAASECGPLEGVEPVDTVYDPSDLVHTGEET